MIIYNYMHLLCVLGHKVKQIDFSTSLKKKKGLKALFPSTLRACFIWHTGVHTLNSPFSNSFHDLLVRTLCFPETTLTDNYFYKTYDPFWSPSSLFFSSLEKNHASSTSKIKHILKSPHQWTRIHSANDRIVIFIEKPYNFYSTNPCDLIFFTFKLFNLKLGLKILTPSIS